MTLEEIRKRRRDILRIASRHGARNVRLFGSTARGTSTDSSDVDLLVDLEPGRTLFDLGGLQMDVQSAIGVRIDVAVDQGTASRGSTPGLVGSDSAVRDDLSRLRYIVRAIDRIQEEVHVPQARSQKTQSCRFGCFTTCK